MSSVLLDHVSKTRGRARQAVHALDEVSLTIEAGEVVLLEGPSGSGKTTLLSVAAGLLTADSGEVELDGRRLGALSVAERRTLRSRSVGFVFQRANLLDGLTARDNVLISAAIAGVPREDAARDTDRLFAELGIAELASRFPNQLSGGEEHRVAVARALVHRPAVVFADEPTGNLDGKSGHAVGEALARLAPARQAAVLIATHDARLRPFASRRLWLVDGRLAPPEAE